MLSTILALMLVSCKPDADVEKWFNSNESSIELSFTNCEIIDNNLWKEIGFEQSTNYLFVYDKKNMEGFIFFNGNYFKMEGLRYNKFQSHRTCVTIDNAVSRVEIIPSGKKYIMRFGVIPYIRGSWEHVATFTQEKANNNRAITYGIIDNEPSKTVYLESSEDDDYEYDYEQHRCDEQYL